MSSNIIIGVSGGSGSGKSTFATELQKDLGEDNSIIIRQDSYYKDLSQDFDFDGGSVNFDHPDAIDFDLLCQHLEDLSYGLSVPLPIYDFATHSRRKEIELVKPKPIVIVDGILIFSEEKLREKFHFKVFINTKEDVRFQRRLFRDVRERGRTEKGVVTQFKKHVKPMHDLFVEPFKSQAEFIVNGEQPFDLSINLLKKDLNF